MTAASKSNSWCWCTVATGKCWHRLGSAVLGRSPRVEFCEYSNSVWATLREGVAWPSADRRGFRAMRTPSSCNLCEISGFRRGVDEHCAHLGFYAACNGTSLPTIRYNLSVPSSRVKNSLILAPWRWDLQFVLKRPWGITITRCVIAQKSVHFL